MWSEILSDSFTKNSAFAAHISRIAPDFVCCGQPMIVLRSRRVANEPISKEERVGRENCAVCFFYGWKKHTILMERKFSFRAKMCAKATRIFCAMHEMCAACERAIFAIFAPHFPVERKMERIAHQIACCKPGCVVNILLLLSFFVSQIILHSFHSVKIYT